LSALNASAGARASCDGLRGRGTERNDPQRRLANTLAGVPRRCLKPALATTRRPPGPTGETPLNLA